MTEPPVVPFGAWPSPIGAADAQSGARTFGEAVRVGDGLWWSQERPDEGGRTSVRRRGADGRTHDVLPAPWSARTRVHEYGGVSWTVAPDGALVFAEHTDQRLYRLDLGEDEPRPLTPAPDVVAGERYADPVVRGDRVWCVRERHAPGGAITRDACTVPLDGSAGDDGGRLVSVVGGSDFLADLRLSPDGRRLAWIAWDHPRMPWDGSELRVATLGDDGRARDVVTLCGGPDESVQQPGWWGDDRLLVMTDRSGWWNLHVVPADGGAPVSVAPTEAELAGPPWQLGRRSWLRVGDDRVLAVRTLGSDDLVEVDLATGDVREVRTPTLSRIVPQQVDGDGLLVIAQGPRTGTSVLDVDLRPQVHDDERVQVLVEPPGEGIDPAYLPEPRTMSFPAPAGRTVHAVVYPPRSPDATGPADERPPYVAFVHGGPTAHVTPALVPAFAYYTSRGIGVVDVNHGGSSGYGRVFRELLRGQWGVVDVEDVVAAVRGLAEAGLADGDRLAVEGGSAGGWTVLAALTRTDTFACGVSFFGVAELLDFAETTHDFESRYLDGLIGPLPQARDRYVERAPLSHVDDLACPVLLLQGLDDPVVPPAQAELFRDAMVERGIPHAYLTFAGEAHGFRRTDSQVRSREAALSFLGQVLGFEPPGVPVLDLWRPDTGSPGAGGDS